MRGADVESCVESCGAGMNASNGAGRTQATSRARITVLMKKEDRREDLEFNVDEIGEKMAGKQNIPGHAGDVPKYRKLQG